MENESLIDNLACLQQSYSQIVYDYVCGKQIKQQTLVLLKNADTNILQRLAEPGTKPVKERAEALCNALLELYSSVRNKDTRFFSTNDKLKWIGSKVKSGLYPPLEPQIGVFLESKRVSSFDGGLID